MPHPEVTVSVFETGVLKPQWPVPQRSVAESGRGQGAFLQVTFRLARPAHGLQGAGRRGATRATMPHPPHGGHVSQQPASSHGSY